VNSVVPYIKNEKLCAESCSLNEKCGFYQYFNSSDGSQPLMCYHLTSCVPKLVQKQECPLEKNNYIDHRLFVQSDRDCRQICESSKGCRFYFWYAIDYSPAPLYCYLFRSCHKDGEEPMSAMLIGGRHPGFYLLTGNQTLDILVDNDQVCKLTLGSSEDLNVTRVSAITEYSGDNIILCGGRSENDDVLSSCIKYDLNQNVWAIHSELSSPREEAVSTKVGDSIYIMGGIIEQEMTASVEVWSSESESWSSATEMPEVRARFCALTIDKRFLTIIGGEMEGEVLNSMKTMDVETGEWRMQAQSMSTSRKDHACVLTRLNGENGIIVSGGVDADNKPLSSVEFFSIPQQNWISLASLKVARTEHGLSMINNLPTVFGGVSSEEFLSSIEQLDSSNNVDLPFRVEWRSVALALSSPKYDFSVVQFPRRMINKQMCK